MKNIKNMLLVLISALLFTMFLGGTALAQNMDHCIEPSKTMTAYLTDSSGNTAPVIGNISDFKRISQDTYESTYAYDILRSTIDTSKTTSDSDSTVSIRFYLTINYKYNNSNNKYLLTKVSGKWTYLDPQVSVSNASVTYGCSDLTIAQYGTKAVSNNFSFNTGFTKYVLVDVGQVGFDGQVGAYLNATLKRGASSSWTFKLENYV